MHNLNTQTESVYIDGLLYITNPAKNTPSDKYWGNETMHWNNMLDAVENNVKSVNKSTLQLFQTFIVMAIDSGFVYFSEWDSDYKTCNSTPYKLSDSQRSRLINANIKIKKSLENRDDSFIVFFIPAAIIFSYIAIVLFNQ